MACDQCPLSWPWSELSGTRLPGSAFLGWGWRGGSHLGQALVPVMNVIMWFKTSALKMSASSALAEGSHKTQGRVQGAGWQSALSGEICSLGPSHRVRPHSKPQSSWHAAWHPRKHHGHDSHSLPLLNRLEVWATYFLEESLSDSQSTTAPFSLVKANSDDYPPRKEFYYLKE